MFLSYLIPQFIANFSSPYNKHIAVYEEHGEMKLLVNGSPQSGRYIRALWKEALKKFHHTLPLNHILVLGLGGGTVINLLHGANPEALITAVDIDKVIIDIAKKYFKVDEMKEVSIIHEDAKRWITENQKNKYDCIVIDLFSGRHIPDFVTEEEFICSVTNMLTPSGCLYINYLQENEYEQLSEIVRKRIEKQFVVVKDCRTHYNRFFYAAQRKH